MPTTMATRWPDVEIDGAALADRIRPRLAEVVVDNHLHLPDMFALVFDDPQHTLLADTGVKVGSTVKIGVASPGAGALDALISGEVTALEADYDGGWDRTVVRGYDHSHRLHRGRHTSTYQNVKVSDVAQTVASRAGLTVGSIDDSGSVLPFVSQVNTTDWDFLKARARELGFEVGVTDGTFYFRKPVQSATGPQPGDADSQGETQLVYGRDLLSFRPRVSSSAQVTQISVRSWDPATKATLVGSADAAASHADLAEDPASLAQIFGSPEYLVHNRPLTSQADVDDTAKAVAEHIGSTFAEAQGAVTGNPKLHAGSAVSIAQVSNTFSGKYTLTRTRHVFDDDGYRTEFEISGMQDRSTLGLVSLGATNDATAGGAPPVPGVFIGQVTNNDDPQHLGRLKLKFPWLSDSYESDWARVAAVGAGPNSGVMFLPEVDDEVLCACEFGDLRRVFVLSPLHNGKDTPNLGDGLVDGGKVKRRGVVSRKGHKLIFLDDASKSGIALITSDGNLKVSLNETNSEITIHCKGKVTLQTDSDDIAIKSGADVTIQAQGNVNVSGSSGVKVDGGGGIVEMSGSLIKLN
ncbi:MAG TPA: VgrG-related protein [Candidatus Saccharimonadales bacterium]|nr:VgrG-related protein [Candidatus Saccharimonadales bacterium]